MEQRCLLHSPEGRYSPQRCWQPAWDQVGELTLKKLRKKRVPAHFSESFAAISTPVIQSHQPTQIPFLLTTVCVGFLSTVITAQLIHSNPDTSSFDLNLGLFVLHHIASESNVFVQDSKTHVLQDLFNMSFSFLPSLLNSL